MMRFLNSPHVLAASVLAFAFSASAQSVTAAAGNPQSTACGDIVNDPRSNDPRSNDPTKTPIFKASLIYECLTSVPFNAAVATQFIHYYNDTLQFQSTLAYLKNPPTSYQQPGIDLVAGLTQLQLGVDNGAFQNQYEFEATLQALLFAAHDSHLTLYAGILAAFTFGSPYDLVSVSIDGIRNPKVYIAVDIAYPSDVPASAIKTINGVDAIQYLEDFAAKNSLGGLESHTDWNSLFFSAAEGIQDEPNIFTGDATFYPGDTITFVLENGTTITDDFLGVYYSQGNTGPLQTGGDFFNFFVLGYYPDSYNPDLIDNNTVNITEVSISASLAAEATSTSIAVSGTSTVTEVFIGGMIASIGGFVAASTTTSSAVTSTSAASASATSCPSLGSDFYPACADVAQSDGLGVSGYFLHDISIGVLSIPSFDISDDADLAAFDEAIAQFISGSQAAGLKKIVIDLQATQGGEALVAIDAFKNFFPNIDPFGGSRLRATTPANIMGQTLTLAFANITSMNGTYLQLVDSEWVATTRINANTNETFASWPEFFGPSQSNGDYFTTTQRYDLNNDDFVTAAFGDDIDGNVTVFGYSSQSDGSKNAPIYAAEDIIMLSDGNCHSACALFMEMMHHEAGVRVVAVGGKPQTGPMQAPGGTRGAVIYDTDSLDGSISAVKTILKDNNSPQQDFLLDRSNTGDVYVTYASLNLRDSVRKNETTPLQFAYEAADCRIFYTMDTIFNYTNLWTYAANAIWKNSSLCVANSTGFATAANAPSNFATGPSGTVTKPKVLTMSDIASTLHLTNESLTALDSDTTIYDFISSAFYDPPTPCETDLQCKEKESSEACSSNTNCSRRRCVQFTDACGRTSGQCLTGCTKLNGLCGPNKAVCAQLPIFENQTPEVVNGVFTCPYMGSCKTEKNGRKHVVGTPVKSKSTSGGTKKP